MDASGGTSPAHGLPAMPRTNMLTPSWASPAFAGPAAPGFHVVEHLPEHLYHASRDLVSKGAIVIAADSLEKYQHYLATPHQETDEESAALTEGSAFHCMVLEPDLFSSRYVLLPDFGAMQSSTNRARRDAWLEEHTAGTGIVALKQAQMDRIQAQAYAVRNHRDVRALLRNAKTEVSVAWTHPETGLKMKLRADAVATSGFAMDLKRARDASPRGFSRAVDNHRYDVQDVTYTRGLQQADFDVGSFLFVACEPTPPYAVGVYRLRAPTRLAVEEGFVQPTLRRIADAFHSGVFPGYTDGIVEIDIPEYSMHRMEQAANEAQDEEERGQRYRSI